MSLVHDQFPYRPTDPRWEPPPPAPPESMPPWLEERLFDRRIVMLRGPLTGTAATQAAAALLTLDAMGAEPVELHLTAIDGELAAAFAVVDAIDAMRAPLHAVVPAQVAGAAIAVLAAARRRLAYPHARIRLAEPKAAAAAGTADEIAAAAGEHLRELDELVVRLAEVTGQPRNRIEDDMSASRAFTAEQAKAYGLIDDIVGPRQRPGQSQE
jgi:ATP-dependent Clp protease protease subunit